MLKLFKLHWLEIAISILFTLIIFGSLQYFTRGQFADPDGFYHAKSSQKVAAGEIVDQFPWLYFTTWNQDYANQHYLYHWLLVPFNTVDKLPFSVVVFALIFVGLFTVTLFQYKIVFKPLWVLLLLVSSVDFLFRINLVKANTISLAFLCLIVILLHWHHYKQSMYALLGIGLISGVFVWTYGGFIFLPILLGAYSTAILISERNIKIETIKKAVSPLLASLIGIVVGMLLHPQSHHLFTLMFDQLFRTGLGAGSVVPAGNEWLAFNIEWFFESNLLILIPWLLSLVLFIKDIFVDRKDLNANKDFTVVTWLQITASGLLVLTLWHRRFVEYWIPFTVLASAMTVNSYLEKLEGVQIKSIWKFWQVKIGTFLLIVLIVGVTGYNINKVHQSLTNGDSATVYQSSAEWMKKNSEPGDIVLNTQWDQFPQLFYYDDINYYIVGLDPTFMYIHDSVKYWNWRKIADDKESQWDSVEQVHSLAKSLQASFVFIDRDRNPNLDNYLRNNDLDQKYFSLGYEEDRFSIYRIMP